MPIHDWRRVDAGTFHAFHNLWIASLHRVLNKGLLPRGYYALGEQVVTQASNRIEADVLALDRSTGVPPDLGGSGPSGGEAMTVATVPPRMKVQGKTSEAMLRATRQERIAVRHVSRHRPVALVEIISPGNKDRHSSVEDFADRAAKALEVGIHLQVLDLFPPGRSDPGGMHAAIWGRFRGTYDPPAGLPLTVAAYAADDEITCYVEPTAVGLRLVDAPLFLTQEIYVNVPLETAYMAAFDDLPEFLQVELT